MGTKGSICKEGLALSMLSKNYGRRVLKKPADFYLHTIHSILMLNHPFTCQIWTFVHQLTKNAELSLMEDTCQTTVQF